MGVADPAQVAAAAWAERLGVPPAPEDNFFAAGGDSVDAARVVRRISTDLGVSIPIKVLFEHPTFAELCGYLATATPDLPPDSPSDSPPAEVSDVTDTHPLTAAQRRLWLHHRAHPTSSTYHVSTILSLDGPLDVDVLSRALDVVVARHEPLRTTYDEGPDVRDGLPLPVAHVHPPTPVTIDVRVSHDVADADRMASELIDVPFDLSAEPPLRAALVRLAEQQHWLVLVVHHIVTDGDAQQVLVDELAAAYDALCRHAPIDLPHLPLVYRQVAGGTPEPEQDAVVDVARFAGASRTAPSTAGDPGVPAGTTAQVVQRLGVVTTAAVRAVAAEGRSTTYATLLAVFAELLARQVDCDRVVIGFPASARDTAHSDELIGLLVDTRAVAIDTSGRPDLTALTDRVDAEVLTARRSVAEIEQIGAALGLAEGVPLFRTWFNHLGRAPVAPAFGGLRVGYREPAHPPALFDLNVYLTEHADDIEIALVHDRSAVSTAEAAELLQQYVDLVRAATTVPEAPLRGIRLRAPGGDRVAGRAHDLVSSDPPCWEDRWATLVGRAPGAPAVRSPAGTLTRQQLEDSVTRVATDLRGIGCGPADTVLVEVERSTAMLVAVLATWRIGAEVLVCDPRYPAARRAAYASAARARIAIRGPGVEVVAARPSGRRAAEAGAAPRYVAFTSGTTGTPVGVRASLRPVEHFLDWYAQRFAIGEHDRVAVLAGLSHDPLLRELLLGGWTGAVTCVPDPACLLDPAHLAAWLAEEQVTVLHLTPPFARLLAAAATTGTKASTVRLLCLGGAELTESDVELLRGWAPDATVVNGFGTTETPQLASYAIVRPGRPPDLGSGAPGSELLVVDPEDYPCEAGRPGRIVVRSRHLVEGVDVAGAPVAGMSDDPERGVRRFVTGDRGLRQVDGSVRFLGRCDGVVDVRGHRVQPLETDHAMRSLEGVTDSVTVARAVAGDRELVSYVVAPGVLPVRLRAGLSTLLPAQSVPAHVVVLDRLPTTPNGKVDPTRLPAPRPQPNSPANSPANSLANKPASNPADDPLETRLHRVVASILGVDDFAATDSFFDLGGSSLTMLRLHTALKRDIAPDLTVVDLYQNPTVRRLARHMGADEAAELAARGPVAERAGQRSRRTHARRSLQPDAPGGARA